MSKLGKLIQKVSSKPKTFKYSELRTLLLGLGYHEIKKGKTSGSRAAFYNDKTKHIIRLHKPHPGRELKKYQINLIIKELKEQGVIK